MREIDSVVHPRPPALDSAPNPPLSTPSGGSAPSATSVASSVPQTVPGDLSVEASTIEEKLDRVCDGSVDEGEKVGDEDADAEDDSEQSGGSGDEGREGNDAETASFMASVVPSPLPVELSMVDWLALVRDEASLPAWVASQVAQNKPRVSGATPFFAFLMLTPLVRHLSETRPLLCL